MMNTLRLLALALALGACSSTQLYSENKKTLERASAALAEGDYARAATLTDSLVASTQAKAKDYRLQRFFAAYVGAQAHLLAAHSSPFLRELENSAQMTLGNAQRSAGSSVAHLVATTRQTSYGLDWKPASASNKELSDQLPAQLAELGIENAQTGLSLGLLVVYAQFGFENRISDILDDNPSMLDLEGCSALMDASGLAAPARPWITYLVFRHLRRQSEPMAYRFAVRTLFPGSQHELGQASVDELRNWIESESSYSYTCPNCRTTASPAIEFCPQDNSTHLIDFVAQKKNG